MLSSVDICSRMGVTSDDPKPNERLGISANVLSGLQPLNALRHRPEGGTCGWYIWAGEQLSDDPYYFESLHAEHLSEW